MKVNIYSQEGKDMGQTLLPKELFGLEINPDLIHQVVVSQMANRRQVIAHTKDRSEVRGGGKKPWRQKGTGRARHGSNRSPIWRGGGITFGPTNKRVFKKIIPKKMKRKALLMALSAKAKGEFLIILDRLVLEKPKTKTMTGMIDKLPIKGSTLLVLPKIEKNIILASRNIPKLETIEARNLNALVLLSFKYLIIPKDTIKIIEETFLK